MLSHIGPVWWTSLHLPKTNRGFRLIHHFGPTTGPIWNCLINNKCIKLKNRPELTQYIKSCITWISYWPGSFILARFYFPTIRMYGADQYDSTDTKWTAQWENMTLLDMNNKGADQPAHLRSLISDFVIHNLESAVVKLVLCQISIY